MEPRRYTDEEVMGLMAGAPLRPPQDADRVVPQRLSDEDVMRLMESPQRQSRSRYDPLLEVGGQIAGAAGDVAKQIPYGFNRTLPIVPEVIRRVTGRTEEQMYGSDEVPTALQRMARSAGEMGGTVAPVSLGMAGLAAAGVGSSAVAQGGNVAQRAAGSVLSPYGTAPASSAILDASSAVGAGTGGQIARELQDIGAVPQGQGPVVAGEVIGGLAPGATPLVLAARGGAAAYRAAKNQLTGTQAENAAKEAVGRELGSALSDPSIQEAGRRAQEVKAAIPEFNPSLAEGTGSPSLAKTQQVFESRLQGEDLERAVARRSGNVEAVDRFAAQSAPEGAPDLMAVERAATGRVQGVARRADEAAKAAAERVTAQKEAIKARSAEDVLEETRLSIQNALGGRSRIDVGSGIRASEIAKRRELQDAASESLRKLQLDTADVTPLAGQLAKTVADDLRPKTQFDARPDELFDSKSVVRKLLREADPETASGQPVTLEGLKRLRETVGAEFREAMRNKGVASQEAVRLEQIRRRIDEALMDPANITPDPSKAQAYAAWRKQYYDEIIDVFERKAPRGVRKKDEAGFYTTEDESVADKFLASPSSARSFSRVFADDPAAMADMEAVVLDDLARAAIAGNDLRVGSVETWWRTRKDTLKEIPSVYRKAEEVVNSVRNAMRSQKGDVDALTDALKPLSARAKQLADRRDAIEKTILGSRVRQMAQGKPVEEVIDEALKKPKVMGRLMGGIRRDEAAKSALRRTLWDRAVDKDAQSLRAFLDENDASLRQVFSKEHLTNLRLIQDARMMIDRVPLPTGRAIEPDMLAKLRDWLGMNPSSLAGRYLAVRRGRSSEVVETTGAVSTFLSQLQKKRSNRLLSEALYNPDFADVLAQSFYGAIPPREAKRRIGAWMIALGIDRAAEFGEEATDAP